MAEHSEATKPKNLPSPAGEGQGEGKLEVYDADANQLVTRTPEQKRRSMHLFKLAEQAELVKWVALKHFFDGGGHLDFGYSTKGAFISNVLHEARRTVDKKLQTAAPFADLMPIDTDGKELSSGRAQSAAFADVVETLSEEEQKNLAKVNQIGMTKLYLFARMEEADFSEALTGGVVKFGEGRQDVALEDILQKSFRQWSADLKAERDALTSKMNKYRREKDEARAEADKLKAEKQENAETVKRAKEIEVIYQDQQLTIGQLYTAVHTAIDRLSHAGKVLTKIKPGDDAKIPSDLESLITSLYNHISQLRARLYENNYYIINATLGATDPDLRRNRPEFEAIKRNPDPNGPDWILDEDTLATMNASQFDQATGEIYEEEKDGGDNIYIELGRIATENGIGDNLHFQEQEDIAFVLTGKEKHFHALPEEDAREVVKAIGKYGFDEVQRWAELGHKDIPSGGGDADQEDEKIIRTDTQRMAIKVKSSGKYGHGWKNLENGFKTEEEMEARYRELLESENYREG